MDRRPLPLANTITLGIRNFSAQRDFHRRLGWLLASPRTTSPSSSSAGNYWRSPPSTSSPPMAVPNQSSVEPGSGSASSSPSTNPGMSTIWRARVRKPGGTLTEEPVDAEFFVGGDAYFVDSEDNFLEITCAPPDNPVVAAAHRAPGIAARAVRLPSASRRRRRASSGTRPHPPEPVRARISRGGSCRKSPSSPRQGNCAVAGSADYQLGLERRGLTAGYTAGSFGSERVLGLWGPQGESAHTFAGSGAAGWCTSAGGGANLTARVAR
jgi:hypothetical protein